MPEADWGTKRLCPTTGKRFYDMGRTPIISPYTGEEVVIELPGKNRSAAAAAERKAKEKKAAEAEDVVDDADVLDDDTDLASDDMLDDDSDDNTVNIDDLTDVAAKDEDD